MDSMRHLSTSLPRPQRNQDQSDLLTEFKAAALTVTNLYKSAAANQVKARAAGYQDALDDLLLFLDRENLGLMDGEGWTVRQWATERLVDDGGARQPSPEEEEGNTTEHGEDAKSSSPDVQRKQPSVPPPPSEVIEISPRRSSRSEPPQLPVLDTFSFRSQHSYPTNHNRETSHTSSMEVEAPSAPNSSSAPSSAETVRVMSRPSRVRHSNHQRRGTPSAINLNLGSGAGNKRKIPYPDFFDISGINFDTQERKDGGGRGGKRGRYA